MKNLIKITTEGALISTQAAKSLAEWETELKKLKKQEDDLKQQILAEMEEKGILRLDTDYLTISYIPESDRETLDVAELRSDRPEVYDDYVKMTKVKSSIRIKVKNA